MGALPRRRKQLPFVFLTEEGKKEKGGLQEKKRLMANTVY
jgi:hypothetical protein